MIDHWQRKSLGLTCDEYCVLLQIYDYCKLKKLKSFIYNKQFASHTKKYLCLETQEQVLILRSLIKKGFFHRTKIPNRFTRDQSSLAPFEMNDDAFEELWSKFGKVGNKKMAKDAYEKTIRYDKHEFLMKRCSMYLEHLSITQQSQLHMSTWLNPDKKRYMDVYKTKNRKHAEGSFFK